MMSKEYHARITLRYDKYERMIKKFLAASVLTGKDITIQ